MLMFKQLFTFFKVRCSIEQNKTTLQFISIYFLQKSEFLNLFLAALCRLQLELHKMSRSFAKNERAKVLKIC
jgi:hypothetical protein